MGEEQLRERQVTELHCDGEGRVPVVGERGGLPATLEQQAHEWQ